MYMYMYTHIYSPSNWTSSGRFFLRFILYKK
uniref:Uncharacterized protein n=1 Tax=Anguilla anguilla TaxID=7936 RepID=A0A0E9U1P4_ANGAN